MITKQEKSIIISLLRDPNHRLVWDLLQKVAQDRINRLRLKKPGMETEWELVKTTLSKEFEAKGIKDFFQEIENYAEK